MEQSTPSSSDQHPARSANRGSSTSNGAFDQQAPSSDPTISTPSGTNDPTTATTAPAFGATPQFGLGSLPSNSRSGFAFPSSTSAFGGSSNGSNVFQAPNPSNTPATGQSAAVSGHRHPQATPGTSAVFPSTLGPLRFGSAPKSQGSGPKASLFSNKSAVFNKTPPTSNAGSTTGTTSTQSSSGRSSLPFGALGSVSASQPSADGAAATEASTSPSLQAKKPPEKRGLSVFAASFKPSGNGHESIGPGAIAPAFGVEASSASPAKGDLGASSSTGLAGAPSAFPTKAKQAPSASRPSQPPSFSTATSLGAQPTTKSVLGLSGAPPRAALQAAGMRGPAEKEADAAARPPAGEAAESDEERRRRFEMLPKENRFFELKAQREVLRARYIEQGILPDPNKAQDLSLAQSLRGTCQKMCPEFEREEREFQMEGDEVEMFPGTSRIDPALAVKIYRRPAAGRELPLPEDVRPPPVLRRTLDYLFYRLLPSDPASPGFASVHGFLWNRTRAIRQDFIVQGECGALTVECHERIARFHILSLHWKGGPGAEGWSEQQELEQLRKTIRSLIEFYDDARSKQPPGISAASQRGSANEAEFRAYNLLLHFRDPDTLREIESLPLDVFEHPHVQVALRLRMLAQRSLPVGRRGHTEATLNMWTRFFAELRGAGNGGSAPRGLDGGVLPAGGGAGGGVTYLLACLAENLFNSVRLGALKAMSNVYLAQHNALPVEYLTQTLGMDDDEETATFVRRVARFEEAWKDVDEAGVGGERRKRLVGFKVCKGQLSEERTLPSPFSRTIVEAKRGHWTAQDIVDGRASGAAPLLPADYSSALPPTPSRLVAPASAATLPAPPSAPAVVKDATFQMPPTIPASDKGRTVEPSRRADFSKPLQGTTAPGPRASAFGGSAFTAQAAPKAESPSQAPPPPATAVEADVTRPVPTVPSSFGGAGKVGLKVDKGKDEQKHAEVKAAFFARPPATVEQPNLPAATAATTSFAMERKATPQPVAVKAGPSSGALQSGVFGDLPKPVLAAPVSAAKSTAATRKVSPKEGARRFLERALQDVVPDRVERVARAAAETEGLRRRGSAREEVLRSSAERMWQSLASEAVRVRVESASVEAVAGRYDALRRERSAWRKWRQRLGEARSVRAQEARLAEVRRLLREREARPGRKRPGASLDSAAGSGWARRSILLGERHSRASNVAGPRLRHSESGVAAAGASPMDAEWQDAELQRHYREAHLARSTLWTPGTFFDALALQLDRIATPALTSFTVALSAPRRLGGAGDACGGSSATTLWLRSKLHLDGGTHAEAMTKGQVLLHATFLDGDDADAKEHGRGTWAGEAMERTRTRAMDELDEDKDLGLVIFECSAALSRYDAAAGGNAATAEAILPFDVDDAWAQERARLAELSVSRAVRRGRFVPKLLLVDWYQRRGGGGGVSTEARRKQLYARLGLGAGGAGSVRSAWAEVALLSMDSAMAQRGEGDEQTLGVDAAFCAKLERELMASVTWNSARRSWTLDDVCAGAFGACAEVARQADELLVRTAAAAEREGPAQGELTEAARLAEKLLRLGVGLVNLAIRGIVDVSDVLVEERAGLELPAPTTVFKPTRSTGGHLIESLRRCALEYWGSDAVAAYDPQGFAATAILGLVEADHHGPEKHSPVGAERSQPRLATLVSQLTRLARLRLEGVWLGATDGAEERLSRHAAGVLKLGEAALHELFAAMPSVVGGSVDSYPSRSRGSDMPDRRQGLRVASDPSWKRPSPPALSSSLLGKRAAKVAAVPSEDALDSPPKRLRNARGLKASTMEDSAMVDESSTTGAIGGIVESASVRRLRDAIGAANRLLRPASASTVNAATPAGDHSV